jgi:hypothetical protein
MMDFERLKDLFSPFKVKHTPKKHQIDSTKWVIAKSMNQVLLQSIHDVVNVVNFLFVNVNEIMTMPLGFLYTFTQFKVGTRSFFWFVWKKLMCKR